MESDKCVEYFKRPNPIWYLLIIPSMVYLGILAYMPDVIPFEYLGPLGSFSRYLYLNHRIVPIIILWMALATHLLEAIYVVKTANSLNINVKCRSRWFVQTLMLGYPSTRLINQYYTSHYKKN